MLKTKTKSLRLNWVLFVLLLFMLASCKGDKPPVAPEESYHEIYESLYLVTNGLEYPANRESVEFCRAHPEDPCYKTLHLVENAKAKLLALPHTPALTASLRTIVQYCPDIPQSPLPKERWCQGALTSLYFFNDPKDDASIIRMLNNISDASLVRVFYLDSAWYNNRSDVESFLDLAGKRMTGVRKDVQLARFRRIDIIAQGLSLLETKTNENE